MSTEDKLKRFLEIKEIPEDNRGLYLQIGMEIIRKGEDSIS
jgi:hypothetical protein